MGFKKEEEFYSLNFNDHIKKVGFVGTWKPKVYNQRQKAIELLSKKGLIDNYGRTGPIKCPDILRKYRIMLNSNELNSPYAKVFEIIKSGSLLLSPRFNGTKRLLLDNLYAKYKNDCSNIMKIAKYYLNNESESKDLINRSEEIVKNYHTHSKRIIEFKKILENLYNEDRIEEIW